MHQKFRLLENATRETDRTGAMCRPRRPVPSSAGVTLLEVLISMAILTIGILSVAALLPVGAMQALQGNNLDRGASMGRATIRNFRAMGLANPSRWRTQAGDPLVDANGGTSQTLPVCIDPFMIATTGGSAPSFGPIPRFTLDSAFFKSTSTDPAVAFNERVSAALRICSNQDELAFDIPNASDSRPIQRFINGSREAENRFTWLATISSADGDNSIAPGKYVILTVVVMYKRASDPAGEMGGGAMGDWVMGASGRWSKISRDSGGGGVASPSGTVVAYEKVIRLEGPSLWLK